MLRTNNILLFTEGEKDKLKQLLGSSECYAKHVLSPNSPTVKKLCICHPKNESDVALVMRLIENNDFVDSITLLFGEEDLTTVEMVIKKVSENKNIFNLELYGTVALSDDIMRVIAGSQLQTVTFRQCKIGDNVNILASSKNLKSIEILFNDNHLASLSNLLSNPQLRSLSVTNSNDRQRLSFYWNEIELNEPYLLTKLDFSWSRIAYDIKTIAALTALFSKSCLRSLNLSATRLNDEVLLAFLPHIADIDEIDISYNSELTKQGLISFIRVVKCRKLLINDCSVDNDVFKAICENKYLEEVSAKNASAIKELTDCPLNRKIRKLNLARTRQYDARSIEVISRQLPSLVELHLDNLNLDDDTAIAIASNLTHLQALAFGCEEINDKGIAAITAIPTLRSLGLDNVKKDARGYALHEALFLNPARLTDFHLSCFASRKLHEKMRQNRAQSTQHLTKELILALNQIATNLGGYSPLSVLFLDEDIMNNFLEYLTGKKLSGADKRFRLSQSTMMLRFRMEKTFYEENKKVFAEMLDEIKRTRPTSRIDMFTLRRLSGLFPMQELRALCLKQSKDTHLDLSEKNVMNREVAALMQVLDENGAITSLDLRQNDITNVGKEILLNARRTLRVRMV